MFVLWWELTLTDFSLQGHSSPLWRSEGRKCRQLVTSYPQSKQGQTEGTQLLLLGHTQFYFSGEFMTHCGLGLPASINLAKTFPTDMRTNKSSVENSTLRLSSRVVLGMPMWLGLQGWQPRAHLQGGKQTTTSASYWSQSAGFLIVFVLGRTMLGVRQIGRKPLKNIAFPGLRWRLPSLQ